MFKKAKSLFSFVKEKLVKTRESITRSVTQVFVDTVATNVNRKKVVIDDNTVNELQEALILSDVSFNSSERIIKKFKDDYLYNKGFNLKDWIKFKGAELM